MFPIHQISALAQKESWRKEIHRPIYHLHKWWGQRLGTVFRALLLYILNGNKDIWPDFYKIHNFAAYTILDPFMGGGTTIGEALKLGCRAIGCDINPISTFLVKQELTRTPLPELLKVYKKLEEKIAGKILSLYRTRDMRSGQIIPVLYYFWVKTVVTPEKEEIPLFSKYIFAQNACPSKKPAAQILCPQCWGIFAGLYNSLREKCPHCGHIFNPQIGPANNTMVTSQTGKQYKIKDLLPQDGSRLKEKMYALLCADASGNKKYQPVQSFDLELYAKAAALCQTVNYFCPAYHIRSGNNTNQVIGYNYLRWKDFFNDRQLYCLGMLLEEILKIEDIPIQEQFLCLFSSALEFNNMFCSFKGEGTGAARPIFSNHIFKPERTPLENSVWGYPNSSGCFSTLFQSRLLKAKQYLDEPFDLGIDSYTNKSFKVIASKPVNPRISHIWQDFAAGNANALLLNGDSSRLPIPDQSVDFIVTDPPYFDFINYSELSDFFYAWLGPILKKRYPYFEGDTSGRQNEVQQKDAAMFSACLGKVFLEANRVLKNNGKLVFSFHHSRIEGWLAIANALKIGKLVITETFPIYAELMASTPKSGSKDPISLDAILICEKSGRTNKPVKNNSMYFIKKLQKHTKLSAADILVICASQCLPACLSLNLTAQQAQALIQETYQNILAVYQTPAEKEMAWKKLF